MESKKSSGSNKNKKQVLGRGLGALLEDSGGEDTQEREKVTDKGFVINSLQEIPVENIEVNPFQPRSDFDEEALDELADSIRTQGIIQPITVRSVGDNKFQLISGERRVQASKKAGLESVPAYIRLANDQQMLEMALIENIQRENLNAIEIALSYQRLMAECELKQEELGDRVGKNRSTVNNYLRLLRLPPDVQAGIRDHKISMGHARALITMENPDRQLSLYHKIIMEGLSVRQVENHARQEASGYKKEAKQSNLSEEKAYQIKQIQNKLSSHFGTRVQVKSSSKDKGEIKIPFVSAEDLNRILDILDVHLD